MQMRSMKYISSMRRGLQQRSKLAIKVCLTVVLLVGSTIYLVGCATCQIHTDQKKPKENSKQRDQRQEQRTRTEQASQ